MQVSRAKKKFHITMLFLCILLGTVIGIWTTSIQGQFLQTLGVSPIGALTIEPLLIITSFLLGVKISKAHKIVTSLFLVVLLSISMLTIVSMYTKKAYVALDTYKVNQQQAQSSSEVEKTINDTLKSLNERSVSAKRALQVIEKLQEQNKQTAERQKTDTFELQAIADTLSNIFRINQKTSIFIFAIFVSLAAVFAPSFLFFSAGMMLRTSGLFSISEIKEKIVRKPEPEDPQPKKKRGRPRKVKLGRPPKRNDESVKLPENIHLPDDLPEGTKILRVV